MIPYRWKWSFITVLLALFHLAPRVFSQGNNLPNPVPFTAQFKVTKETWLADGSKNVQESTETRARDLRGRILHSTTSVPPGAQDPVTQVTVLDPASHRYTVWNIPGEQALITELPKVGHLQEGEEKALHAKRETQTQPPAHESWVLKPIRKDLGIREIAGVEARGGFSTFATPGCTPQRVGDCLTAREIWMATEPGLMLIVLAIENDPIRGKTTTELVSIEKSEPAVNDFQPPSGYKISTRPDADPCSLRLEPLPIEPITNAPANIN